MQTIARRRNMTNCFQQIILSRIFELDNEIGGYKILRTNSAIMRRRCQHKPSRTIERGYFIFAVVIFFFFFLTRHAECRNCFPSKIPKEQRFTDQGQFGRRKSQTIYSNSQSRCTYQLYILCYIILVVIGIICRMNLQEWKISCWKK